MWSSNVWKHCGNDLFMRKNYEIAIKMFKKAVELCPTSEKKEIAILLQNIAACYFELSDFSKVIEECTNAIQLNSTSISALKRRANAFKLTGYLNEALNDLAAVCVLDQQETIAMFEKEFEKFSKLKIEQMFTNPGKLNEALNNFSIKCSLEGSHKCFEQYGQLLDKICDNETEEWINNHEGVLITDEVIRIHFSNFTRNGFLVGDVDSNVLINELSSLDSDLSAVDGCQKKNAIRGTLQYLKTNYSDADTFFNNIVKSDCNKYLKVYAYIMLSITSLRPFFKSNINEAQFSKSFETFDAAIEVDAFNADIYFHRAVVYFIAKEYKMAIGDLNKYVHLTGNKEKVGGKMIYIAFHLLMQSNASIRHIDEFLLEFEKEIYSSVHSSESLIYYISAMFQCIGLTQRYSHIHHVVAHASKLVFDKPDFQTCIAYGYMMSMEYRRGIEILEEVVKNDKYCQSAYEQLILFYVLSGLIDAKVINLIDTALKFCASRKQYFNLIRLKKIVLSFISLEITQKSQSVYFLFFSKFSVHLINDFHFNWFHRFLYNGIVWQD
ncbi:mitochondrial import receptor subunit TOM70-like protein [Leptotrombidium deliense]|uniref:Mitochondrial import receptor subunit TOM70-like protein n=1 Tax=Leptotrombidium deliense TaxID=299467 RepID=A0A443S689_9ACAR|nr:mitochondrial import receptor subunit TOM70-like protein [Leptotrombidium deliense]